MNKAETERKKSLARALYLSGMEQTEIAEKVQVSRVTISKWAAKDGWKEARAAKSITRPELVNKLLLTIDKLIEQVNQSDEPPTSWRRSATNCLSCHPSSRNSTRKLTSSMP